MRSLGLKFLTISAFAVLLVTAGSASAQNRRGTRRERQQIQRQRDQRVDQQRSRAGRNNGRVNAALLQGYQQGLVAGRSDGRARKYNRFNVYRNTGSAPNSGDPTSYDYLYRQGYLEGYEDGYNGRTRY